MTEYAMRELAGQDEPSTSLDSDRVLQTLAGSVVVADASGRIVYVNQALEKLLGWPAGVVVGEPITMLMPERFREAHLAGFQRYLATRTPKILGRPIRVSARHHDGSEVDIELSLAVASESAPEPLFVATIRDMRDRIELERQITAERQARAQAEVTQEYFAFLAEASRVLTSSLDYQVTLRNVARLVVPRLADWCSVHIVEEDGSVLQLATAHVDPKKVALAEELGSRYPFDPNAPRGVAEVLRTGRSEITPALTDEMLVAGATNDEILAILRDLGLTSAMIVPLLARGRILGAITLAAAESGRHYGPHDLEMAEDLARRAAIAVDNARLYTQLQEANLARDEFISSVSHDLKNPLATLRAQTQLLQRRVSRQGGEGVENLRPGLNQLEATTTRMEALIGDLVDAANIRAGRPLSLVREPLDLVALSRRMAEEQQLSAPGHTIEVRSDSVELIGQWDARRLERVLWNLLSNAVKYSPDGGPILLTVTQEETPHGPAAVLMVCDDGIGIPSADLPHIFERYHRGANVTQHIAGTGIGLATVWHIVEQHGGSITVESEEGHGARFTVRLPITGPEDDPA